MRIIHKYDLKKNDSFKPNSFSTKKPFLKKKKKNLNEDITSNDFDFTSNDSKSSKFTIKKKKIKTPRFNNVTIKQIRYIKKIKKLNKKLEFSNLKFIKL